MTWLDLFVDEDCQVQMSTADMPESEQWGQAVRQEWADADVVAAWRKWYPQARIAGQTATEALVDTR
jgi:hypothetical protein